MHSRDTLPVVVGGTNYYIESLLWKVLVDTGQETGAPGDGGDGALDRKLELEKLGVEELHKRLAEVDPKMAAMLHPNDKRKITRSLQIHEMTGVSHTRWLQEQRGQEGGDGLGGPLRYSDPCIFWLHADTEALDKRLDARVDEMLSAGLIEELRDFHVRFNQQKVQDDSNLITPALYSPLPLRLSLLCPHVSLSGWLLWPDIKEFHEFLTAPESSTQLERDALKDKGIEALKIATRRYARKQNKWVRNRFLKRPGDNVPLVFGLEVTDVSRWEETVLNPALQILDSLSKGEEPAIQPIRIIIGDLEWTAHLKSKKHHHHVRKKRKTDSGCEASSSAVDSVSEDSSAAVAPGSTETSQESSPEAVTTHKEVPVTF
ncbi:tRNA dimethylallyltransferase [Dissostichus eleginoides]|uniref:tRNA dimethylallyltransferase n=1 Tax=Dissostichus eleginoides TaxID=100907 RepID=A0AAD9BBT9_DISEL|nr:tRNA dimethylallyltransferase [Dissostichus eleginoides]